MTFCLKDRLNIEEYNNIINFLDSLNFYCIEQHPNWYAKVEKYPQKFFWGTDEKGVINCFGNIIVSKGPFKTAYINFGPAFSDYNALTKGIEFLHSYFSTQKFLSFTIQLGNYINNHTELLEYNINKTLKVKYSFAGNNSWSSICVDLKRSENEILSSFSKGHKSTIKSAYKKKSLRVSMENNPENLSAFIDVYIKMISFRKLQYKKEDTIHFLIRLNDFIYENKKGFIEYIFDESTLVGGLIFIYQGNSIRCFKGASDPGRRDIPISHFGYYEAMKYSKANGYSMMDLWGYNHLVDERDQLFNVNKFKKGFGGEFTFFPKRMNFIFNPPFYRIYNFLKLCKKTIKRRPELVE